MPVRANPFITMDAWLPWYARIAEQLRLDRVRDEIATQTLSRLLEGKDLNPGVLEQRIGGRPVLVFGAGPSLERNLNEIDVAHLSRQWFLIAADGATTAVVRFSGRVPDAIVTDLDGQIDDILAAHQRGARLAVHAHGDNIPELLGFVPLTTCALGTTQVEPKPRVFNFGGFTDGDRAVFIACAMGAETIALAGMDLGTKIGPYSKRQVRSLEAKLTKLRICKELLEWLAARVEIRLLNSTCHGERIQGFQDIPGTELRHLFP